MLEYQMPTIRVLLQPEEKEVEIARGKAKTVGMLLNELGLKQGTALVIRSDTLLTPDLPIYANDSLIVRKVMSSG